MLVDSTFGQFQITVVKGDFTEHAGAGNYEDYVLREIVKDAARAETIVDIGGNIGLIALPMAAATKGTVYCLEISQRNCKLLLHNARRNNLANIVVLPVGAGDRLRSVHMEIVGTTTLQSMVHTARDPLGEGEIVLSAPLDLLFQRVDLIKIDTDGDEYRVLRGASRILATCKPIVYLEYCPPLLKERSGVSGAAVLGLLLDHGYLPTILHRYEPPQAINESIVETVNQLWQRDWDAGITHLDIRWAPQ